MIADLKPYPEYKESGLPWLGQVPGHWAVKRAKSIFHRIDERSKSGREELLTVSSARGIVPRKTANVTMFKADSYLGYKLCWPGDLVINSLWAWAGGLGVSKQHGIISSAYGVYRVREAAPMLPAFVHEVVRSLPFSWELRVRSKGVWISRLQLTDVSFLDAPMHIPPPSEQAAIVRFLDWANGRLERAIRAKRKVIALLNEQKQAIIHRAVTRGLDPSVPLRPSGIPWLGDIPQHWKVCTLKLLAQVKDGTHDTPQYRQPGANTYPLVTSRHIVRGTIQVDRANHISQEDYESIARRSNVALGDVIMPMIGTIGNPVVVGITDRFAIKNVALFKTSTSKDLLPAFLVSLLESPFVQRQFDDLSRGGVQGFVSLSVLRNLLVPKLDRNEQAAIVAFLDTEFATVNAAISRLYREIELLREYRTRLVADVVTGKLDVREAATRLPDEAPPDVTEDDPMAADEQGVEDAADAEDTAA